MCYHPSYRSNKDILADIQYFGEMEKEASKKEKEFWRETREMAEKAAAERGILAGAA